MIDNLRQFLTIHIESEDIVIAYSGGLDSSVLLHMLWQLKQQGLNKELLAIHVHHGLSDNADRWAEHCEQTCLSLGVQCRVAYAQVKRENRRSLEQQARTARYELLEEFSDEHSVLLTAQHQDDQAETLLLQLMRGAGPKGLSAMSESSVLVSGRQIYRPLLQVTRSELEAYAKEYELEWVEDESNKDCKFDRNFVRNQVIPLLNERWPSAAQTISRSAKLCDEQQRLIESAATEKLQFARIDNEHSSALCLDFLGGVSQSWFNQILRVWFRQNQADMPSVAVMQQIYQQMFNAKDDAKVCIRWGRWQLRRFNQRMFLLTGAENDKNETTGNSFSWDGKEALVLPNSLGEYELQQSNVGFIWDDKEPLVVEFGHLSAKLKAEYNRPSKAAKQWFKEWRIPPWQRLNIPFFYYESKLVQVGDNVNLSYQTSEEQDSYRVQYIKRYEE